MKIIQTLKKITLGLFRIDDTPQKVALGLGLGVFCGILPGTGPLAAIFLAFIFRVNRAASILGSLTTNTWLSFLSLVLAVKIGAWIWGLKWLDLYDSWASLIKDFHWQNLFKTSILGLVLPVATGFLFIAFCLGLLVYLTTLIALKCFRQGSQISNLA